jgi:sulfofructose kinase
MASLICVGISVLDRVWRLPALPSSAGKFRAQAYLESGGGPAATAAVTIARLGHTCEFWGRVGADGAGEVMMAEFRNEGVDVCGVRRIAGANSMQAAVVVDQLGERLIVVHQDPCLEEDASFLSVPRLKAAAGVLADVHWVEGAERTLAAARRRRLPSVLDVEPSPPDVYRRLCPLATHVIFSSDGLADYAGTDDVVEGLTAAHRQFGDVVAVTMGPRGVTIADGSGLVHLSAPRVAVVDTTGAGDAFHGAYLVGIVETGNPVAAARFANAVAALKCTRLGGRAGLPNRRTVETFLASNPPLNA